MSAPSWAELHARGMTAAEAAAARGKTQIAAYQWASKAGVKWRSARPVSTVQPRMHVGPTARRIIAAMLIATRSDAAEWEMNELARRLGADGYLGMRDGIADAESRGWVERGRIDSGKARYRTYRLTAAGLEAARTARAVAA